jgi:hypothetical protein
MLKPALRRLWRDAETLQLGVDSQVALVLEGVSPAAGRVLALLDGTRDTASLLAEAEAAGVAAEEVRGLISLLSAARALDDGDAVPLPVRREERERLAPDLAALSLAETTPGEGRARLARRRKATVRVHGACRVGAPLAALLAAAGVGRVSVVDEGAAGPADAVPGGLSLADTGRPRSLAAADLLTRCAPGVTVTPQRASRRVDLVVLAGAAAHDVEARTALMTAGTAHLAAGVRDLTGVVGPLVLPGRSPCLRCLDFARRERDPAWPALAAQLLPHGGRTAEACDGILATTVAATAAWQALAHLDGEPEPAALAGTLELTPPGLRWRRRSWAASPECGCL